MIFRNDFEFDFEERSDDVLLKPIVRAIVWMILCFDFGLISMTGYVERWNLTENPLCCFPNNWSILTLF